MYSKCLFLYFLHVKKRTLFFMPFHFVPPDLGMARRFSVSTNSIGAEVIRRSSNASSRRQSTNQQIVSGNYRDEMQHCQVEVINMNLKLVYGRKWRPALPWQLPIGPGLRNAYSMYYCITVLLYYCITVNTVLLV